MSAHEWAASAAMDADPDNIAATVLAIATAKLAAKATNTVNVLSV